MALITASTKNRVLLTVVIALILPALLWPQAARSRITGVVKDSSGAVVPGATITVTQQGTGLAFRTQSQANGVYLAPNLAPGVYNITGEATGFKKLNVENLSVDVSTTLTQDLTLELGAVSESIEVQGQNSLVETTSGSVGTTVQMTHVLEMALTDRTVFNLINLTPGAFFRNRGNVFLGYLTQSSLAGGRSQSSLVTIDGVDNTRGGVGIQNTEMAVPVDAVQEFKVITNSLSAEYGRTAGGAVNVVTKSGTNQFHGSFYEFVRNDMFDAVGWGNTTTQKLRRNTYGGTIGGPIRKNCTFFFFNYDGLRNRTGNSTTTNVGLPAWRSGDFSTATRDAGGRAVMVPIYDPATGSGTFGAPRSTLQFPNNIIPTSRLDPVAVKYLSYLPAPNRAADNPFNQTGNFRQTAMGTIVQNYWIGRVDHELRASTKVFGRYILTHPRYNWAGGLDATGPLIPGERSTDRLQNYGIGLTHIFSPTLFMNFTAGVERLMIAVQGGCAWCGVNYATELGLKGVPGPVMPQMQIGGGLVPLATFGGGPDRFANVTNTNYVADFTKVRGNHTVKFGGQYSRFNNNTRANTQSSGQFTYDGHFTQEVDANGTYTANTGIQMADFLLGRINTVSVSVAPTLGRRAQYVGFYAQDDWRITSRLTLNLGIRWDTQNPTYGVDGRMSNFDPYQPNPLAGKGDIPAGAMGVTTWMNQFGSGKYLWNWDKKTIAPRFGFAWRIFGTNETVLRGGYGVFFGSPTTGGTNNAGILGYGMSYSASNPVPFVLKDGVPAGAVAPPPADALTPTFGDRGTAFQQSSISFYDPYRALPYAQNFNVTLQHQWKSVFFEAGYLANLSRHVAGAGQNINLIPPQLLSQTGVAMRLRRPYTILASDNSTLVNSEPSWGISNYHAFTLKVERRFKNGLMWTANFSQSKWIDNVNAQTANGTTLGDNAGPQFFYSRSLERSRSTNDMPRRLVISPVYELPFGKGKPLLDRGGIVNILAGGWQLSTMATMLKGAPFGVTVLNGGTNLLGDPNATLRPDLVADPNSPNHGQPAVGVRGIQWLNPAAFANPARYTYGNQSRTLPGVLGPGTVNFDIMIAKVFTFKERFRMQFRWEALDAFNSPVFTIPANSFGGGSFGVVNGAEANSRRIMQVGAKLYW